MGYRNGEVLTIGDENNYVLLNNSGLTLVGDATTWDDLRTELNTGKQGQTSKPDYDFDELGLLFPQNVTTEIAYMTFQMTHSKKMDSDICLHIHYIQSEATQPTFECEYRFYNNGEAPPTTWNTGSTAEGSKGLITYTSGDMMQIAEFPNISVGTGETVSAMLDVKLWRNDNDTTGDVLAKYVDCHIEVDSMGSKTEYTK